MQQIGRFRILGELGRGAMGVVYRAQDPAIGRTIAIKTIRLNDLTDPSERDRLRERLFREAQSAGILSHPNIVTIYDILEENGLAYIFMELVNGPTLETLLGSAHPPDRHTIFAIFRQTASALDYAHRKGIVHRDIKPANIMIHDDGSAKITDFGVAKIVSSQMTQSGTMMGTPSYMSPEQVQGAGIDGRSDQFALAVIAYEILTGEKPFAAEYLPSLLYKIVREEPVPALRLNPTLGSHVDAVLQRGLAKAAAERFATCCEFIQELEVACAASPHWVPMPRGSSHDMPTLGTTTGGVPVDPPKAVTPPPAPPAPPVVKAAPPPSSLPPARPAPLEEPPPAPTHTVRNVVLAIMAVLVLAGIVFLMERPDLVPGVASTAPPQQTPSQPPPPANDEQKPSPTGAVEPAKQEPEKPQEPVDVAQPPLTRPAEPTPRRRTPMPVDEAPMPPVQIVSVPGGAHVLLDGSPFCTTPCSLPIPKGRHVMLLKLDGYRDARRIIEVPQEMNVTIDMDRMMGALSVASTPPGAVIIINGQQRAEKTPAVFKLPVGSYRLQVVKDGVKTDEETIDITDGGMSQRRYRIE